MIRDQFKDVKKVTSKEARKKATIGERNYYSKRINRLHDLRRSLGVSMVITSIIMGLAYAVILFVFIITRGTEIEYELWKFIVWTSVFGVTVGFTAIWYLFLKPKVLREIERCKHELERLNARTLSKAASTYAVYGDAYKKQQEHLHQERKLEAEKLKQ